MSNLDRRKIKLNSDTTQIRKPEWDETFKRISWWDSERMASAKVLVVGAGALGNEALKNLALLGVGNIFIIDFDIIEYGNLNRSVLYRERDCGKRKAEIAAARVKEINPHINVQYFHGDIGYDLGLGVFRRMDVVIGCLDNRIARLYINRHCYKVGKTWIDGGIENLNGQLDVFIPNETCYECMLTERDYAVIRHRESCTDVAKRNDNFGRIPTTPISASIIAAMEVQEAMKVIYGNDKRLLRKKRFRYFGMLNEILYSSSSSLKEHCVSHVYYENILEANLSADNTLGETLTWVSKHLNIEKPKIMLNYDIVLEFVGEESEQSTKVVIPKPRLSNDLIRQYQTIPGETLMMPTQINYLDISFEAQNMSLYELGIPHLQILEIVNNADDLYYVELKKDENILNFGKIH